MRLGSFVRIASKETISQWKSHQQNPIVINMLTKMYLRISNKVSMDIKNIYFLNFIFYSFYINQIYLHNQGVTQTLRQSQISNFKNLKASKHIHI